MKQDERARFDRALHRARLSAYPPGEFVGQEGFMRASEILALAVEAGVGPGVYVLDLCCGVAGPGRLITQELGCTYVGVDSSSGAVDIAREGAGDLGCRFEVSRIPPVPPGPFDVVLLLETMLAFPDKQALLREISSALKPGGRFAFTMEWDGDDPQTSHLAPKVRELVDDGVLTPAATQLAMAVYGFAGPAVLRRQLDLLQGRRGLWTVLDRLARFLFERKAPYRRCWNANPIDRQGVSMLSWGVIGYGAALSALLATGLVAFAGRERRPAVLVCAAASALLGAVAWNAILRAAHADQFFHDAPIPVFPISWQDTGSGVFTVAVAAVLLGFGPLRADPARRFGLLAVLAGLAALLVDIYLY